MRMTKIGSFFIISVLAIAGIGIGYAGFFDEIYVYGTVDTGTVELEIVDYSCTYVWKIWDCDDVTLPDYDDLYYDIDTEIAVYHGFPDENTQNEIETTVFDVAGCQYERVASAEAKPGTSHDGQFYDVDFTWNNIFPCIYFWADFVFEYTGSIPVKVSEISFYHISGYDFTPYITWDAFRVWWQEDSWWTSFVPVRQGDQLHNGDHVLFEANIYLPQDNDLQDLSGEFSVKIEVKQWNDLCEDLTDIAFYTDKDVYEPGEDVTIILENNGDDPIQLTSTAPWVMEKKVSPSMWSIVYSPPTFYVITPVNPGESKQWIWAQNDDAGDPVGVGSYRVSIGIIGEVNLRYYYFDILS